MAQDQPSGDADHAAEAIIGRMLQAGVLIAAAFVLVGAVVFLAGDGARTVNHRVFQGEPAALRSPVGIVQAMANPSGPALIQFGLLLLIATPVARVVFSVYAFARMRDRLYVVVTLIVLSILAYSLVFG